MKKKYVVIIAAALLVSMTLLYFYSSSPKPFEKVIPEEAKPIQYCKFILESDSSEHEVSDEELTEILDLLNKFQYEREGSSEAIQNCVARLFLGSDNMQSVELMLTSDLRVLVNDLRISNKSVTYEMLPNAEVENGEQFMNELFRILK